MKINYANKVSLNPLPTIDSTNKIQDIDMNNIKDAINQIGSYILLQKETSVVKDTTVKYYCELTGVLSIYDVINVIFPNETENLSSYPQISIDNQKTYHEIRKGNSLVALRDLQGKANVLYFDGTNWQVVSNVVNDALNIFPVGSLFFSTTPTNPSAWMGGTWEIFGNGRVLVGVDSSDNLLNASEKTGGSINPLSEHSHLYRLRATTLNGNAGNQSIAGYNANIMSSNTMVIYDEGNGNPAGDNSNHNNWQPYITCYIWKRIA